MLYAAYASATSKSFSACCRCNTRTIIDGTANQHNMTTFAHVTIKAGEQITNQYMKPDKPTVLRRPFLQSKWFFDCNCQRCMDPTELGSHLSSLKCQVCMSGKYKDRIRDRSEGSEFSLFFISEQQMWRSCNYV